ncbi:MAG TPA: CHAD domain-containing protein [Solirubrobacteraceae bacterium]|nr:CHAD domain-containing protein [Solirubrobacteraceae bacterium]
MAKAAPVPIHADMTFAEAASQTVAVRAAELWQHADGVLDTGDIERVHDMRVATRRLRAVLEIFAPCFPRDDHRAALREVKALADALGARRDPDVQLDALAAVQGAMGEAERPGLELFGERLRAEQAAGNDVLAAALRHAEASGLRERLERLAA